MLAHPILAYLINLSGKGVDLKKWLASVKNNGLVLNDYGKVSKKKLLFYYQKYLLLQENGYFTAVDIKKKISGKLSAKDIEFQLANSYNVVFEVTDACNLGCEYCGYGKFYSDYDKRENKNLTAAAAKNLLNYLQTLWASPLNRSLNHKVNIGFYGGEPLLNLNFIKEIVDFAKNMPAPPHRFTFSMTTNGLLLLRDPGFLVENNFQVSVSLDGDEKNNAYRVYPSGKPAFKDILKSVNAFRERYPDFFKQNVNFIAVLHNKNSAADIHKFFKENFDKTPRISEVNLNGIVPERKEEFLKTYRNLYESLDQAEDYAVIEKDLYYLTPGYQVISEFLRQYSGYVFKDYRQLIQGKKDIVYTPTATCLPFSRKVFLTVNGKILPCERIGHKYGLGFAGENKVDLDFQKIADTYNSYYEKLRKQCGSCATVGNCQQCMFLLDMECPDPECRGHMDAGFFTKYISAAVSYLEKKPASYTKIMKEIIVE